MVVGELPRLISTRTQGHELIVLHECNRGRQLIVVDPAKSVVVVGGSLQKMGGWQQRARVARQQAYPVRNIQPQPRYREERPSSSASAGRSITPAPQGRPMVDQRCNFGAITDPTARLCPLRTKHVDSIIAASGNSQDLEMTGFHPSLMLCDLVTPGAYPWSPF